MADMNKPLLEVKNLKTFFKTRNGIVEKRSQGEFARQAQQD